MCVPNGARLIWYEGFWNVLPCIPGRPKSSSSSKLLLHALIYMAGDCGMLWGGDPYGDGVLRKLVIYA